MSKLPAAIVFLIFFGLLVAAAITPWHAVAQVPACVNDTATVVPCPTATAVPPSPTATPVPATPVVITRNVVTQCEGPYLNTAPYALQVSIPGFQTGINIAPWAGSFGWPVPTLVTRVDGVVTSSVPNAPQCMAVQAAPPAPVAPTAAPQVIVVTATPQPQQIVVPNTSAPLSGIRPPSTGDAGLAD